MKKVIIICIMVLLLVAVAAVGIGYGIGRAIRSGVNTTSAGADFKYSNPESYEMGNAEVSQKISKITINWVNGEVEVSEYNGSTLTIKDEVVSGTLRDELKLRWKREGNEIIIQYAEAGKRLDMEGFRKNLVIMVPSSWTLDELNIDVVSADSTVTLGAINEVDWNSVNGKLDIKVDSITKLEGDTVNGDVSLYAEKKGPKELDLESVNSDVTISVPFDSSFTLKRNSINGTLDSEFSGRISGSNTFIVGTGDSDWDIESVNGKVKIKAI